MSGGGVLLLIVGLGLYVELRWRHDRYLAVSSLGIWRQPPSWIRLILRRGDGPVIAAAAVLQVWCLAMIAAALAILGGWVDESRADNIVRFVLIGIGLPAVGAVLILGIGGRLRRQR